MSPRLSTDSAAMVETIIQDFIQSAENTLQHRANEKAFDVPLIGFSRGDDSLYESYKGHIGPFHWTPWWIFTQTFPGIKVKPEHLTVISWVLPQTKATK